MTRRVAVFAALAGLVATAHVWPAPLSRVPDTAFSMGHLVAIGLARAQLLAGNFGTHVDQVAWPTGADVRPLLWPVNLVAVLTGNVLAFNLFCAALPLFNAAGATRLARALGLGPTPAATLALLLAWNPWVRTTLANGQVEQAVLGGLAWIWAAGVAGGALELAAAVLTVGLAAPHVALAAALGLPFLLRRDRRGALAAAVSLPAWYAVYRYHAPGFDPSAVHLFAPFGSEAVAAGAPAAKHAVFPLELVWPAPPPPVKFHPVVHLGYLGAPLFGFAAFGLRRRPALGVVAGLAVLLALAVLPLDAVPLVARSATPYRFTMTAFVALAVLAATVPRAGVLVAVVWVEALVVDRRPFPLPAATLPLDASSPALAGGEGAVLDVPALGPGCHDAAAHFLAEAVRHGRPVPVILRDGLDAWPGAADRVRALDAALHAPTCADDVRPAVAAFGVHALVAHLHPTCRLAGPQVDCLTAAFGPPAGQDAQVLWWTLP